LENPILVIAYIANTVIADTNPILVIAYIANTVIADTVGIRAFTVYKVMNSSC